MKTECFNLPGTNVSSTVKCVIFDGQQKSIIQGCHITKAQHIFRFAITGNTNCFAYTEEKERARKREQERERERDIYRLLWAYIYLHTSERLCISGLIQHCQTNEIKEPFLLYVTEPRGKSLRAVVAKKKKRSNHPK